MRTLDAPVKARWRSSSIIFRSKRNRSASRAMSSSAAVSTWPQVSTATWMAEIRHIDTISRRNAGCISGSPPEKVTPPPDSS